MTYGLSLDDLKRSGRATINVEEAGRLLGISRGAAYAAARNGELPILRLGARMLVSVPALIAKLQPPEC
jgi:excisionase family DNA binding protein